MNDAAPRTGRAVLLDFLASDATPHVRTLLLSETACLTSGIRECTFNVFNVTVDVGSALVTIDDDLDTERTFTLPLAEFLRALAEDSGEDA
ncbi:hypothetical protein M3147_08420 [Agromyces mediolanus]|uniref:hypothetical protein n=1 Tax=Agromyces mediolanus TaxID=41986 RepID=UPI00203C4418|nr:hypothetical protein [Agromyces mediolanus]MCM3657273.1 hypothetical protein [Agromyces mediolanus]